MGNRSTPNSAGRVASLSEMEELGARSGREGKGARSAFLLYGLSFKVNSSITSHAYPAPE